MKLSLTAKFFVTILAAVCMVVTGMFFLVRHTFDSGFLKYINTLEEERLEELAVNIETAYGQVGNWDFVRSNYRLWRELLEETLPEKPPEHLPQPIEGMGRPGDRQHPPGKFGPGPEKNPPPHRPPASQPHLFEHRVVLTDSDKKTLFGPPDHPETMTLRVLKTNGRTIGFLGLIPQDHLVDDRQLRFVREQKRVFSVIALVMPLLAALLALPLAKQMVKRLKALGKATHKLAAGQYDTRLATGPDDELGKLIRDFNTLAKTLKQNEQLRQQWAADISHEFRTPLAVLRGEIEAMQDKIRPVTQKNLSSLHGEVLRLQRLVDDLHQLTLSDLGALTYQKKELNFLQLLDDIVESFRPEFAAKDIVVTTNWSKDDQAILFGDPDRLHQLFDNLLSNSLKYTGPAGQVFLTLRSTDNALIFQLEDSAPGVDSEEAAQLFEKLYRAKNSRTLATGGAGLGLAICKNIVAAHEGEITAKPSSRGGLAITIHLPRSGGNR